MSRSWADGDARPIPKKAIDMADRLERRNRQSLSQQYVVSK
jgi:hypothetical protein